MKIEHIVDTKSYGIAAYAHHLTGACKKKGLAASIKHHRERTDPASTHVFHYSNSSRGVLLPLLVSQSKKRIVVVHDVVPRNKVLRLFARVLLLPIKLRADTVIVHSQFAKRLLLQQMPLQEVRVVPHGLHLSSAKSTKKSLRKKHGVPQNAFVILLAGTITAARGQLRILESLRETDSFILVAGLCTDENAAQTLKNYTSYRGFVPDDVLLEYYSLADALLVYRADSVGESSGVIAQALGHGLPVLASRVGSFPEMVGNAGILFDNNNPRLASHIQYLRKNIRRYRKEALRQASKTSWTLTTEMILCD